MNRLAGKKAVITGGTSGIGLATAKHFHAEGAHVVIMGRRKKELEEAVAAIGQHAIPVQGDVSELGDIERLYKTVEPYSPIDIVFAMLALRNQLLWRVVRRSSSTSCLPPM